MNEFTVKVKDLNQGITHTSTQYATSQRAANKKFVAWLQKALGHKDFEVL